MTRKQAFVLNGYWQALHDLNEFTGRNVTAGELAGEMGVSRNTAHKYLQMLMLHNGAGTIRDIGKNGLYMNLYYAISQDAE